MPAKRHRKVNTMAGQFSCRISRLAALSYVLVLLASFGVQAQSPSLPANDEVIFSLEGPRVQFILLQASVAEARQDFGQASELYCEAAFYGSLEAQYRLARIILNNQDSAGSTAVARDKLQTAATLLRDAAGSGHEGAQALILNIGEQAVRQPECLDKEAKQKAQDWRFLSPLPTLRLKLTYALGQLLHPEGSSQPDSLGRPRRI